MLIENTLFGIEDKIKIAIGTLRIFEPLEGYYVAFSGGKDSIVIKDLCIRAGVKFDVHYNNPTIDPFEVVAFIRKYHPDVQIHYPPGSYFKEIVNHGFPLRTKRWCCEYLKEWGGVDRLVITGVRADESIRRRQRRQFESCNKRYHNKRFLHIILHWTKQEVWEYIRKYDLPYCLLYDEGFDRIGCIACPGAYYKKRIQDLERYPRVEKLYRRAFNRLYEKNKQRGNTSVDRWKSGDEMFYWWITNKDNNEDTPLFA